MKPICATVDQASAVFTALCVSMTTLPKSAVNPPSITSAAIAPVLASMSPEVTISSTPPALMMPACSSAETGVGASITSVSHPCSGKAAVLSAAVSTSSATAICAASGRPPAAAPFSAARLTVP